MKKNLQFKSGYVAIVGRPNVGKSTLVNSLLDFKLSIVTPKPQTTRHRILGILSENMYQAIFLDTPGLIEPKYKLQEVMAQTVTKAVNDADVVLFMIDATKDLIDPEKATINRLKASTTSIILVINKVDNVKKCEILPLIDELHKNSDTNTILPISALTGEGLEELKKVIFDLLPTGQPLYPLDQITEHPEKFFVAEIIREKIFQKYGDEIPYATTVLIDEFKERKGRKDYINARIIVERKSQKAILIGKGGKALKEIGQLARNEIEALLCRTVFLELWVAVREKWRSKDLFLKEFGYK